MHENLEFRFTCTFLEESWSAADDDTRVAIIGGTRDQFGSFSLGFTYTHTAVRRRGRTILLRIEYPMLCTMNVPDDLPSSLSLQKKVTIIYRRVNGLPGAAIVIPQKINSPYNQPELLAYYRTQKRSIQAGSTKRILEEEPALPVMDNPPLLLTTRTRTTPTLKATIFEEFGTTRRTTMHHQFACTYMNIESDRLLHSRTIYTLNPGLLYHEWVPVISLHFLRL